MSSFKSFQSQPKLRISAMNSTRTIMFHSAIAERLGLHATDHKCLLFLSDGPKTPSELALAAGLSSGALTSVVDRLEKAGYVRREADPHDRRRVLVRLTPKAGQEVAPLFAPLAQSMAKLEKEYTPEQLDLIAEFMERAGDIVYQETLRLRKP